MSTADRPATVLLVDDRDANRYAAARHLRAAGMVIAEAATGADCLRQAAESPPDLIVLDILLPDLHGVEVLRRLKADPRTEPIPVLLISAAAPTEDRVEGLDAGADGFLLQPVNPAELIATVRALLRAGRAEAELRRLNEGLEDRVRERTAEIATQARALEAFATLARELSTAAHPHELIGRAQEIALTLLPAGFALYYEPEGSLWRLRSQCGPIFTPGLQAVIDAGLDLETTENLRIPWRAREPYYQDSYDPTTDGLEALVARGGIGATACLPILVRGEPRGVFVVVTYEPRAWTAADRAVLEVATRSLGPVLEAHGHAERLDARNRALEAFAAFTDAVGTETSVAALADRALAVVSAALVEDVHAVYWELEGGTWKGRVWSGNHRPDTIELFRQGIAESTPTHRAIMATEEVVFFDGWTPDPEYQGSAEGYPAAAGVRLLADGHAPAILGFALSTSDRWSDEARAVLRSVARALLIAVQRGRDAARLAEQKAELEAQKAELEARNAEQETFVYTVSHDLRAPLLSLQGMGALLAEAVTAGDAKETDFFLGRISANAEKMGRLLDDLLALSRAGRDLEPPAPVDLGDALRAVLAELEPLVSRRGAVVEEDLGECPLVLYPRVEAEQVLTNLLSNALKFAGRPGEPPRVRVTCGARDGGVVVRVEDDGPGIAPEYRERVFGLFQRLDARAEGTGVGLAIVRRIAERHGGRVALAESSLGGACFEVTMPTAN